MSRDALLEFPVRSGILTDTDEWAVREIAEEIGEVYDGKRLSDIATLLRHAVIYLAWTKSAGVNLDNPEDRGEIKRLVSFRLFCQ
jgi:hypothetical protein